MAIPATLLSPIVIPTNDSTDDTSSSISVESTPRLDLNDFEVQQQIRETDQLLLSYYFRKRKIESARIGARVTASLATLPLSLLFSITIKASRKSFEKSERNYLVISKNHNNQNEYGEFKFEKLECLKDKGRVIYQIAISALVRNITFYAVVRSMQEIQKINLAIKKILDSGEDSAKDLVLPLIYSTIRELYRDEDDSDRVEILENLLNNSEEASQDMAIITSETQLESALREAKKVLRKLFSSKSFQQKITSLNNEENLNKYEEGLILLSEGILKSKQFEKAFANVKNLILIIDRPDGYHNGFRQPDRNQLQQRKNSARTPLIEIAKMEMIQNIPELPQSNLLRA